jgi:hypothetical protein
MPMEQPRWLTMRADGIYDDQGRRRITRGRANALHLDRIFELHRAAKAEIIRRRESQRGVSSEAPSLGFPTSGTSSALRGSLSVNSSGLLRGITGPRPMVAAGDPCYFDATLWCANSYGSELGIAVGSGSGSGSGPGGCAALVDTLAAEWVPIFQTFGDWLYSNLNRFADANDNTIGAELNAQLDIVVPLFEQYVWDARRYFVSLCWMRGHTEPYKAG